jgi:hypothetical protein
MVRKIDFAMAQRVIGGEETRLPHMNEDTKIRVSSKKFEHVADKPPHYR